MSNVNESPELRRQQQLSEILAAVKKCSDSTEEQERLLELALADIRKGKAKHAAGIEHQDAASVELAKANSVPLAIGVIDQGKPAQKIIGILEGEQIGRKDFLARRIR